MKTGDYIWILIDSELKWAELSCETKNFKAHWCVGFILIVSASHIYAFYSWRFTQILLTLVCGDIFLNIGGTIPWVMR